MKRVITFFLIFFTIGLFNSSVIFAQADTVIVPTSIDGDPYGAINKFIQGDTTATGERNNPDRVYKLQRDSIYYLSGTLKAPFNLKLVADAPDETHRPPIITTGIGPNGEKVGSYFKFFGNILLKNLYIQHTPPTGGIAVWGTVQQVKDSATYRYEGCYFEGGNWWTTIATWAKHTKVFITDCYFRNVENPSNVWNGVGITFANNDVDTLEVTNTTFFNHGSFAIQGELNNSNYVRFEHNTFVNSVKNPIWWKYYYKNFNVSNNIFYNAHSLGSGPTFRTVSDPDSLEAGIIQIYHLPKKFTDTLGLDESQRIVRLHNNDYFYSQVIKDYWNANDTIMGTPWMNARVRSMFDDDANFPDMDEQNTMNLDPGFVEVGKGEDSLAVWMTKWRAKEPTQLWGWDPDGDRFAVQWPLPENLSYTNATLLTAADGGFPVGDLNWFPDKKQDWITGVKKITNTTPENFELKQNYPNPFNPETNIQYSIPKTAKVNISIFNSLGQKVVTLVNQKQNTGNYKVNWNGKDANGNAVVSGVYFYKLSVGTYSLTRKMILLK